MQHDQKFEKLEAMGDWELEHESQDIRGRPLVGPNGEKYGVIDDLLVDKAGARVAAVRLEDGRCCAVESLEIHENVVVYGEGAAATAKTAGVVGEEVIPVIEERIEIGKRMDEDGKNIRVRSRVVSEAVAEDVTLRDETVSVDHRATNDRLSAGEAKAAFEDRDVSMTERDEKLVVAKDAVKTGEVTVKKTAADRVERVEETVRKTQVDVDVDGKPIHQQSV